jgi:uncharacterized protein with PIN domain
MRRTREQMKAQLRAAADAMIEQLLDWHEESAAPSLMQIEDWVLELRERLGQRMAETVIEAQDARQLVEAPVCPQCGERMRYKDQKATQAETRVGLVKIERGYYHCARCRSGLFPPG